MNAPNLMGLAVTLVALPALAADGDIVLRDMGSFHIGGRIIEMTGQPVKESCSRRAARPRSSTRTANISRANVRAVLPAAERKGKLPLLLWHGGGLSGVTYETKPDGRDGWMHYFIRKGWDTYVSDAIERGRSGSRPRRWSGEPIFLNYQDP